MVLESRTMKLLLWALVVCGACARHFPAPASQLKYNAKLLEIANRIITEPELEKEWEASVRLAQAQEEDPPPIYECQAEYSASVPTSVHKLRPSDVKVVAAYGDSITAGNGVAATNVLEVALENRGQSWSIGGDKTLEDNVITLPNILRKFNPDLKGASVCASQLTNEPYAWMNLARPGARADDIEVQSQQIIDRLKEDERIDYDNDWKVITMFIGGNDLCIACEDDRSSAESYAEYMRKALDILHVELPRAFVNLVAVMDVTSIRNLTRPDAIAMCTLLHWGFCSCAMNDSTYIRTQEIKDEYYDKLYELVESGRYETRDDFTVVLQPHMKDLPAPLDLETGIYDISYVSYDCFHPSLKAHQSFAYMLWQAMLIPHRYKPCSWDPYEQNPKYYCPTEEYPYFFTRLNSNVTLGYQPPMAGPFC